MGALFESLLLFVCWLAALATLLVFLETWFGLSGRNPLIARRASGAYGLISLFVPMYGGREKVLQTVRSVLGQSYPFIELRSEEHTSELQSRENLVCRLLLEKK